jgi:hypothetical protein
MQRPFAPVKLVAAVALAAAALAGCHTPTKLAVDGSGYHVRGDYIGSQRRVKLFVERLGANPLRAGRGTAVIADLALLNERAGPVRFDAARNTLDVSGVKATPAESHMVNLPPGVLTRVTLTFPTKLPHDDFSGGTMHIEGIESDGGEGVRFSVPFSSYDVD